MKNVLLNVEGSIATVTLNRPEVHNAFDAEMWVGLKQVAIDITSRPDIHVVIVTGAGDSSFSSGIDLKAIAARPLVAPVPRRNEVDTLSALQHIFSMYDELPVPVIAAINGYCLGAGMELTLCCDIRLAADDAVFALPEVDLGAIPDMGATQRLPRVIGPGHAKELIYTCRRINAVEALRIHLVNHVYPKEQLMAKARELAQEIAAKHPATVQAAKKAVNVALSEGLQAGLAYESSLVIQAVREAGRMPKANNAQRELVA